MSRAKLSQLSTRLSHVEGKNGGGLLAMVSWNAPGMEPGQWSCQSTCGDCAGTPPEDVLKLFEGDEQE